MKLPWRKDVQFVETGAPYPPIPELVEPSALARRDTDVDAPQRERRNSGGDFPNFVVRAIEAGALGSTATADATFSGAIEAAAGFMSRTLAAAKVTGPDWARQAITPTVLGQIGRDLIRDGESLHKISVRDGRVWLLPSSSWNWHGGSSPARLVCAGNLLRAVNV